MEDHLRIESVAVVVDDGVAPFELGVACELFGLDRSDQGLPVYEFGLAAVTPGPVATTAGFAVSVAEGLDRVGSADLVVLPAGTWTERGPTPDLRAVLHAAHDRGAHIMAICRGAFVLAATGLLDGRRASTHWRWEEQFRRLFPRVHLDTDALYVDTGAVSTSAGTAAGIDLGLHLLRRAHGAATAAEIARRMVVAPHRSGGQAQYIRRPMAVGAEDATLQDTLQWALDRLPAVMTVDELAAHANLAPRTFARRFHETCGTTPHRWLDGQRVDRARQLLETTDLTVAAVAARSGFGSTDALRAGFARHLGTTPTQYRRSFHVGVG
ncbi:GlxA family transcriptional regulator [Actinomycetospora straminea]|uniref:Helix-turn-helix domain-containing protein n=1 Tax=Actinomycetospora straminea TaxID=663607 RepID=A0ABP9E7S7_9PSEU|nr:helix-turn-helix domain-containing protein [Actinomycetospora straminea]MDD7935951.1 helix-turn-helix domain-containing protein [Actinomycetospora straminea]